MAQINYRVNAILATKGDLAASMAKKAAAVGGLGAAIDAVGGKFRSMGSSMASSAASTGAAFAKAGLMGAGAAGWRLCSASDWQTACEGGAGCDWSYASSCTTSQPTVCNGTEFDAYPSPAACMGPGDQDCITTTGSPLFPMCSVTWDGDAVFDLSGNVKEWTSTARGGGTHEIRGGSFNNIETGRNCDFDFTVAADAFAFPNTGFRCCYLP